MSDKSKPKVVAYLRASFQYDAYQLTLGFSSDDRCDRKSNLEFHGWPESRFSGFHNVRLDAFKPEIREVEETLALMRKVQRRIDAHFAEFGYGDMAAACVVACKALGVTELSYFPLGGDGKGENGRHAGYTNPRDAGAAFKHASEQLTAASEARKAA